MNTWQRMERLVDEGLVRHIGTSNMMIPKLDLLLRDARIPPACSRRIKGQVFHWKEGRSWEDFWDVDGTITPP